jgi:Chaperone of endosialidase
MVSSTGELGIVVSSARYKRDIDDMGEASTNLMKLRPVTFRYKNDPAGQRQYGLIAEEVAGVYPELVVRGTKGEIESLQYQELIPMLLNEVQHQQQTLGVQTRQLTAQFRQLSAQSLQLAELKAQNKSLRDSLVQQNAAVAARLDRLEKGAVPPTLVSR